MNIAKMAPALALVALLAGGLSACSATKACRSDDCIEDARINREVQNKIDNESALRIDRIYVETSHHTVYLNGVVDSELEVREADSIARSVPGVMRVINKLAVRGNSW